MVGFRCILAILRSLHLSVDIKRRFERLLISNCGVRVNQINVLVVRLRVLWTIIECHGWQWVVKLWLDLNRWHQSSQSSDLWVAIVQSLRNHLLLCKVRLCSRLWIFNDRLGFSEIVILWLLRIINRLFVVFLQPHKTSFLWMKWISYKWSIGTRDPRTLIRVKL